MFVDVRNFAADRTISPDICIAGAGVAGISLAREFIGEDLSVCLLEAGGLQPDRTTQSFYWGENVGHPYFELDTARAGGFGGTSNRWSVPLGEEKLGVRLRPLDPIDFEERSWVPYSGWPFGKGHLDPYYIRAHEVCKIGPYDYEPQHWEHRDAPVFAFPGRVRTAIFQFGPRETFYKDYRNEIEAAENITAYLHANVIDIEKGPGSEQITRLRAVSLNGKKLTVKAGIFVLALGGIETPRIMLLSNRRQKEGLGNQNGLVGRFFMEHPHLWSGYYVPAPGIADRTDLYERRKVDGVPVMGKFALLPDVLRAEGILNYCVSIHKRELPAWHVPGSNTGIRSLKAIGSSLKKGEFGGAFGGNLGNVFSDFQVVGRAVYDKILTGLGIPPHKFAKKIIVFQMNHMSEQAPNPASRVTLSDERDLLGRRRPKLDWRLTPLDIRTIERAQEITDLEMRKAGLGKLEMELRGEKVPPDLHGGWHHMGTTRMHRDAKLGVVDENCRVHGFSNLFIAGSSVFPTGGFANPVLTSIALTLRLADHLKKETRGAPCL
jgi:choline dehydrogenase-like flavoprotein